MSKELALQQNEFLPEGLNLELHDFINADKQRIKDIANNVAIQIQDGNYDGIDALIFIKKGSELFKELDAKVRPLAESKQIGVDFQKFGVKITEGMTGVKYDYTQTGDIEYQQLVQVFDAAKEALKSREDFLKAITKPIEIVDTESGETYTVNPPIKSGKMGFTLTIK